MPSNMVRELMAESGRRSPYRKKREMEQEKKMEGEIGRENEGRGEGKEEEGKRWKERRR